MGKDELISGLTPREQEYFDTLSSMNTSGKLRVAIEEAKRDLVRRRAFDDLRAFDELIEEEEEQ